MQLAVLVFGILFAVAGAIAGGVSGAYSTDTSKDGYHYRDCADDSSGPPLAECAKLRISSSLENVYIDEFFEEGLSSEADRKFLVLRSKHLPIAIPKENYRAVDSWLFAGRKYFKIKKSMPTLTAGQDADVIAVVGNLDRLGGPEKITGINSFEALQNVVLTFFGTAWTGALKPLVFRGPQETGRFIFVSRRRACLQTRNNGDVWVIGARNGLLFRVAELIRPMKVHIEKHAMHSFCLKLTLSGWRRDWVPSRLLIFLDLL